MYVIAGLGNPGKKYELMRHNVGFQMIDMLGEKYDVKIDEKQHRALIGKTVITGEKVMLVKPQTFMNLSGESLREILDYYDISADKLIVIYDDIYLDFGRIRIRGTGSAGGHNGMQNVIKHMKTGNIKRVRVGVGSPPLETPLEKYVLSKFSADEDFKTVDISGIIESIISDGIILAMSKYNG